MEMTDILVPQSQFTILLSDFNDTPSTCSPLLRSPALHSVSHNQPVKCWYFLPSGSESRRKVSSSQSSKPPTLPPLICKYIWWRLGSENSRFTGNILVKYLVWSVFELLITGRWECLESGTTSLTLRRNFLMQHSSVGALGCSSQ